MREGSKKKSEKTLVFDQTPLGPSQVPQPTLPKAGELVKLTGDQVCGFSFLGPQGPLIVPSMPVPSVRSSVPR